MATPPEKSEVTPAEAGGPQPEGAGLPCKYCGTVFKTLGELGKHLWEPETAGGHRGEMLRLQKAGVADKAKEKAEEAGKAEKKPEAPPTPPERQQVKPPLEAAQDEAISLLESRLPEIYGMSAEGARAAVERLKERPDIVWDPNSLYFHIMQYAGPKVNEYDLKWLLSAVQSTLGRASRVPQQPPFQTGPPQQPLGYQPPFQGQQAQPQLIFVPGYGYVQQTPQQPQFVQPGQPQPGYVQPPAFYPPYQPQPARPEVTREDLERGLNRAKEEFTKGVGELLREEREARDKESLISVVKAGQEQTQRLLEKIEKGELIKTPPAGPPPTPAPTKEELAELVGKAAGDAAAKLIEAKGKEDREERRHAELLSAVRTSGAAAQVSGYKEDSYRLLGQGLSAAAAALERKEPIKVILEHVPEILGQQAPPPKEVAPGAAGGDVADRLNPAWVVQG